SNHAIQSASEGSDGHASSSGSQNGASALRGDLPGDGCDTAGLNRDELTLQFLERARQHYQAALEAQGLNDSVQSANEFEYTIAILNELGYYPNIDTNREFNDLSRSVVEDYEKYIAVIDSLGPQTSVFAL